LASCSLVIDASRLLFLSSFSFLLRSPPTSTLSPYTTLFRSNHIVFQDRAVHRAILQCLGTAPSSQITDQSTIKKVELWCFDQTLQEIVGVGMQIKDNP